MLLSRLYVCIGFSAQLFCFLFESVSFIDASQFIPVPSTWGEVPYQVQYRFGFLSSFLPVITSIFVNVSSVKITMTWFDIADSIKGLQKDSFRKVSTLYKRIASGGIVAYVPFVILMSVLQQWFIVIIMYFSSQALITGLYLIGRARFMKTINALSSDKTEKVKAIERLIEVSTFFTVANCVTSSLTWILGERIATWAYLNVVPGTVSPSFLLRDFIHLGRYVKLTADQWYLKHLLKNIRSKNEHEFKKRNATSRVGTKQTTHVGASNAVQPEELP